MAFVKLEVARGSGRSTADVRVMVSDVRSTRQVGIIMARGVMDSMGIDLGAELDLHVGQGEDAGWLRLETASGRNGRKLGKLPQTQSGLAKFPVVAPLDLPEARSTDVEEWRVELGALTLRLPATLRGATPDKPPAAPSIARRGVASASASSAPPSLLAAAGDAIRAARGARPAGPAWPHGAVLRRRDPGHGQRLRLRAPGGRPAAAAGDAGGAGPGDRQEGGADMSPERQAAAIVGADGVEALSAAGLLIVTADRVAALIDARNEALKHNAILGAMIRDVRAEASADRARLVRYYEDRLREVTA